jgi:hypothetical protein
MSTEELDDIRKRLEKLESRESLQTVQRDESTKPKRPPSAYQIYMKDALASKKLEAERAGVPFNHKQAFSEAAKEWSSTKK